MGRIGIGMGCGYFRVWDRVNAGVRAGVLIRVCAGIQNAARDLKGDRRTHEPRRARAARGRKRDCGVLGVAALGEVHRRVLCARRPL